VLEKIEKSGYKEINCLLITENFCFRYIYVTTLNVLKIMLELIASNINL